MALPRYEILGVSVVSAPKQELIGGLERMIQDGKRGYVATVNPEFIVAAQVDEEFREVLSHSTYNTADGVGVVWAAKFLSLPASSRMLIRTPQVILQGAASLAAGIVAPRWLYSVIRERAPGTELFWDIAKLAEKKGLSIFLIGGFGETPSLAGDRLMERFPDIKIAGTSNRNFDDELAPSILAEAQPDIVYVAFGGGRQEKWVARYQSSIGAQLMIGLGGTFDYVAGVQPEPPRFMRRLGLEWLYRLLTQPKRYKRIFTATIIFPFKVITHKIKSRQP